MCVCVYVRLVFFLCHWLLKEKKCLNLLWFLGVCNSGGTATAYFGEMALEWWDGILLVSPHGWGCWEGIVRARWYFRMGDLTLLRGLSRLGSSVPKAEESLSSHPHKC